VRNLAAAVQTVRVLLHKVQDLLLLQSFPVIPWLVQADFFHQFSVHHKPTFPMRHPQHP